MWLCPWLWRASLLLWNWTPVNRECLCVTLLGVVPMWPQLQCRCFKLLSWRMLIGKWLCVWFLGHECGAEGLSFEFAHETVQALVFIMLPEKAHWSQFLGSLADLNRWTPWLLSEQFFNKSDLVGNDIIAFLVMYYYIPFAPILREELWLSAFRMECYRRY